MRREAPHQQQYVALSPTSLVGLALDDGIKALSQDDATNYVNGRYALRGKTISEIVHMTDNGLVSPPPARRGVRLQGVAVRR